MNGHGQIVGFWFVDQDSAEHLKPFLDAVKVRFDKHGSPQPILAYGDNCCGGDRTMLTGSFTSLNGGLDAQAQREREVEKAARKLPKATLKKLGCDPDVKLIQTRAGECCQPRTLASQLTHGYLM